MSRMHKRAIQKSLHDPYSHDSVVTRLEPDIPCEVKWALGSITTNIANGGDGIPSELFQIPKDDAVKVLHSIYQQIWKTQQWPQDCKRSVSSQSQSNANQCSNYHTTAFFSHSSKVISQNSSSYASKAHEPRASRCSTWI